MRFLIVHSHDIKAGCIFLPASPSQPVAEPYSSPILLLPTPRPPVSLSWKAALTSMLLLPEPLPGPQMLSNSPVRAPTEHLILATAVALYSFNYLLFSLLSGPQEEDSCWFFINLLNKCLLSTCCVWALGIQQGAKQLPGAALRMLTVSWLGLIPCHLRLLLESARCCEEKRLLERGCGPGSQPREPLECSWASPPDPSDFSGDIPGV